MRVTESTHEQEKPSEASSASKLATVAQAILPLLRAGVHGPSFVPARFIKHLVLNLQSYFKSIYCKPKTVEQIVHTLSTLFHAPLIQHIEHYGYIWTKLSLIGSSENSTSPSS